MLALLRICQPRAERCWQDKNLGAGESIEAPSYEENEVRKTNLVKGKRRPSRDDYALTNSACRAYKVAYRAVGTHPDITSKISSDPTRL